MLSTIDLRSLHRSLLSAFDEAGLDQVLRLRLGTKLDLLASTGDMNSRVFQVIRVAERAGWTQELVRAAYEARPHNADLARIAESMGLTPRLSVQRGNEETVVQPQMSSTGLEVTFAPSIAGLEAIIPPDASFTDPGVFREQLSLMERRVCRVEIGGGARGTGFLVGPDVVLTCYYVVAEVHQAEKNPADVRCRFDYRIPHGDPDDSSRVLKLNLPSWLVDFQPGGSISGQENDHLDYALLRLERPLGFESIGASADGFVSRGWIELPRTQPTSTKGSAIMIFSHAGGGALTLAMNPNGILDTDAKRSRLKYVLDTQPGSGGAPCFSADWKLIALHESHLITSRASEGILAAAIRDRIEQNGKAAALGGTTAGAETLGSALPADGAGPPPKPAEITNEEDPQKNRWGGLSQRNGRAVSIKLHGSDRNYFNFDIVVSSTDGTPLTGPVVFHLHDTYPRSVIHIRKIRVDNSAALEEVSAYGVYTFGVQVKDAHNKWIGLEYDLSGLKDLPKHFLSR